MVEALTIVDDGQRAERRSDSGSRARQKAVG